MVTSGRRTIRSLWRSTASTLVFRAGLTLDRPTLNLHSRLRVMSSCAFGSDFTLATFGGQLTHCSTTRASIRVALSRRPGSVGTLTSTYWRPRRLPTRRAPPARRGPSPPPRWRVPRRTSGPAASCSDHAVGRSSRPTAMPPATKPAEPARRRAPRRPARSCAPDRRHQLRCRAAAAAAGGVGSTVSSTRPVPSTTARRPPGRATHATGTALATP